MVCTPSTVGIACSLDMIRDAHVDAVIIFGEVVISQEGGLDDFTYSFTGGAERGIDFQIGNALGDYTGFKARGRP